jgi:L-alanine-DL-glutamate epimerase-like enolase superfamily enzyme
VVNITLDKTGGLTEALRTLDRARSAGLDVMVGCMLGTSLAMAPAMLLAQSSRFVDLDAPLLIGKDSEIPARLTRTGSCFAFAGGLGLNSDRPLTSRRTCPLRTFQRDCLSDRRPEDSKRV